MLFQTWALLLIFCNSSQIFEEDSVWILNDMNFKEAMKLQKTILVDFYAPWCEHSKKLASEYSKAAFILKNQQPPIHIAKIDATTNPIIADIYGIAGYPTLKLISEEGTTNYPESFTEQGIASWVIKKSQPQPQIVHDFLELQQILKKSKASVVLFTKLKPPEYFVVASKHFDDVLFIVSTNHSSFSQYSAKDGNIIMFKQYDDKIVHYLEIKSAFYLTKWVENNKTPLTQPYNNDLSYYIFQEKHPALFFFRNEVDALSYNETYQTLAKEYKNLLTFTHADLSSQKYRKIGEFFEVSRNSMPTFLIIDHKRGEINKYFYYKDAKYIDLKDFILKWKNGDILPYIKSSPMFEQPSEELVKIIVAQNFEDIVLKSDKDVLVLFCAPFTANCKNITPDYELIAYTFRNSEEIAIVKIDSYHNTVKGHFVEDYPTIKFFPANNKNGILFQNDFNYENMFQFIREYASFNFGSKKVMFDL